MFDHRWHVVPLRISVITAKQLQATQLHIPGLHEEALSLTRSNRELQKDWPILLPIEYIDRPFKLRICEGQYPHNRLGLRRNYAGVVIQTP